MSLEAKPSIYGPRAKAVARGLGLPVATQIDDKGRYVIVADTEKGVSAVLNLLAKSINVVAVVAWGLGPAQVARLTRAGVKVLIGIPRQSDWESEAIDPSVVEDLVRIEERFAKRATT